MTRITIPNNKPQKFMKNKSHLLLLIAFFSINIVLADSTLTQKCLKQLSTHTSAITPLNLNTIYIEPSTLDLIEAQTSIDLMKNYIVNKIMMNTPQDKSSITPIIAKDSLTIRYTSNW